MNDKEYKIIGEYACVQADLYNNAMETNAKLLAERAQIEMDIHDAELKHDEIKLNSLYDDFRRNKMDIEANRSFRENLSRKVILKILDAKKGNVKEIWNEK